ncbi:MAG TPA: hypothetical protein VF065_06370 [Ilumatobacter sp.]
MSVTLLGGVVALGLGAFPCDPPRDHRPDVAVGVIAVDGSTHFFPAGGAPIALLDDGPGTAWPRSVAVTPDGRDAWVTECCEPVWGQWWHVDVGVGPRDPVPRPGYAFDLDPSAKMLTSLGYYGVAIRDLDGAIVASENDLNALPVPRDPYDTAWIGRDRVAFLEFAQPDTGDEFRLVVTDARLTGYRDATGPVIATDLEAPWPRLAGADTGGRIMVFQADDHDELSDIVRAYDSATLEPVPTADIHLPRRASSIWIDGDHLMWIDRRHQLTVDGERIRGRYEWVRSA